MVVLGPDHRTYTDGGLANEAPEELFRSEEAGVNHLLPFLGFIHHGNCIVR